MQNYALYIKLYYCHEIQLPNSHDIAVFNYCFKKKKKKIKKDILDRFTLWLEHALPMPCSTSYQQLSKYTTAMVKKF